MTLGKSILGKFQPNKGRSTQIAFLRGAALVILAIGFVVAFQNARSTSHVASQVVELNDVSLREVRVALLDENSDTGADGDSKADVAPPADEHENADEREIRKLIPDQKVLVGSPDTVIDLTGVFEGTDAADGGGKLSMEVKLNKKDKTAKASIEDNILRIVWGKTGKDDITIRVTNQETNKYLDNKFHVAVWEPDYWKLVMTVIGGLGIFLLGMKNMSEGMQAIAGSGLRRMISAVTDNRLMATGVGVLVTMLVQSSSITTVMVVGFVNSGFMTLSQAIGVIMGANIGTTITGWILVLKIGKFGMVILGLSAFGYLFSKRDRLRYVFLATMGLGMVFFGLELMKDGFSMVKNLPEFEQWFHSFSADTYLGVLKCAMVGCLLTFIVQSSSATLGITIGLAMIDVIPYETAAALVLGENIGTTITAWLASFGATTVAKRAAYFHVIFNLIGVFWITLIFSQYIDLVQYYLIGEGNEFTPDNVAKGIATVHTGFNIANTLMFFPFAGMIARGLERIIPEKAHKEKPHLTSLDVRMLDTPTIATEQSRHEVIRMADGCRKMMDWLKEIMSQETPDDAMIQKTFHREEVLDTVHDEIVHFVTSLLSGNVPFDVAEEGRHQLRAADEYESVSDYIVNILKSHLKLGQSDLKLPDEQQKQILELHDMVAKYLEMISAAYENRQVEIITKANSQGDAVVHRMKQLRDEFLQKLSDHKIEPLVGVAYNAQLNAYRRVRDHALNIAETLSGEK